MDNYHEGERDCQLAARRGLGSWREGERREKVRPCQDELEPEREQERVDALQAGHEHGDVLRVKRYSQH